MPLLGIRRRREAPPRFLPTLGSSPQHFVCPSLQKGARARARSGEKRPLFLKHERKKRLCGGTGRGSVCKEHSGGQRGGGGGGGDGRAHHGQALALVSSAPVDTSSVLRRLQERRKLCQTTCRALWTREKWRSGWSVRLRRTARFTGARAPFLTGSKLRNVRAHRRSWRARAQPKVSEERWPRPRASQGAGSAQPTEHACMHAGDPQPQASGPQRSAGAYRSRITLLHARRGVRPDGAPEVGEQSSAPQS